MDSALFLVGVDAVGQPARWMRAYTLHRRDDAPPDDLRNPLPAETEKFLFGPNNLCSYQDGAAGYIHSRGEMVP